MSTTATKLRRIAIVNRGEPAMRLIHAVRELELERARGLVTIALHTEAERSAMFVREADEAVRIGPGPGEPPAGNPYLDHAELERALGDARADAAWVGWGFVAEDAAFADLCERLGVTFVGPSGDVMRRLGDKIASKRLAEQAGVPVAPWSGGPVDSVDEARGHARSVGYPLMVKATAGGGGWGIRVVRSDADLAVALERARDEARRSFGDPTVFMERMVTGAHHVEVQIIADGRGGVWAPGVRDCSVQRRNQKVLEESSSAALTAEQEDHLKESAAELARLAGYRGAGTVEFLYQPTEQLLSFLEVNTRLQVEHPVTELVTGLDLVKLQLHVAGGGELPGQAPPAHGHAIEVRLNAEDAERGFSPSPGTVELLHLPAGPGVRVDTGVAAGDVIPPEYDSMVAKIIAWGHDRSEALARVGRALSQTTALVRGGTTNRAFLLELVAHPDVVDGKVDTGWLDRLTADGGYRFRTRADVALVAAAIEAFETEAQVERSRFYASAGRGRPEASTEVGRSIDLRLGGVVYRVSVSCTGPQRHEVLAGDAAVVVDAEQLSAFERRLTIGAERYRVMSITQGADRLVEVDGVPHRISQGDAGLVRTPGPGLLVALTAEVGDQVDAGAAVAVLESMKMETVLAAPVSGHVREVLVSPNVQLDAGTPVMRLEPTADGGAAQTSDGSAPVDLQALAAASADGEGDPSAQGRAILDAMRRLVLGYDISAEQAADLADGLERLPQQRSSGHPDLLDAEIDVLRIFADLASLTRNRRIGDEEDSQETRAAREHLHAYLRSLDVEAEGLPDSFRAKLERALAHYGVHTLDRRPELEEALYRVHLSQQRAPMQLPVILGLLERRLRAPEPPRDHRGEALRETLDHLIRATQVRHPAVGDLARRARYRCFDQPRLDRERSITYNAVRRHLAHLVEHPEASDRDERMAALVAAPQPLLRMLEDPLMAAGGLQPMLEVLTRRYYRTRDIDKLRAGRWGDHKAVLADVTDPRGRGRVVALGTSREDLAGAVQAAHELVRDLPQDAGSGAVADVYVTWPEPLGDGEDLASELHAALAMLPPASRLRRVTFSVTTASPEGPSVEHLTFRRVGDDYVERRYLRGIHPLIAGRLDLWRFEHFDLTRLPSADEVYLFRCVARDNPADERLVAMGEVRDVTPMRGADGRVASLPELERVFAACIADLRQARALYPVDARPEWNRVLLYVWPPVDVPLSELDPLVRALAPMTEDLGLEQVVVQARIGAPDGEPRPAAVRMHRPPGRGLTLQITDPPTRPLQPLDEMTHKILRARRRGTVYPHEIVPLLTRRSDAGALAPEEGAFTEYDLDDGGRLVPVDRPPGRNTASVIVGTVRTPTETYPEGMTRVALLSDPTKGLGSLAEAECRRVIAALELARRLDVPVEWFAVSSGARIAMDSGTENMDWVGQVLRRIVEHTQAGGEINVVVTGINVGAQPYWNAEATMLMHTRGILVMTPGSAMVLTGKQALDYSGGVSAEDNFDIGGYDRVMGPNGQAQYWAADLAGAVQVLFSHYDHTYRAPGERFPRQARTDDPADRDVRPFPHSSDGSDFTRVGDIFDEATNPGRKKAFDVRTLMRAVIDADHPPLERWKDMADADTAVVFDAHLGGHPVAFLGFESRPIRRRGLRPADGPEQWTAGTLFPRSSKKTARAINAASGNRPLAILANLSGFDGSPESLRELQLEFGAEIGRAVINFDGPIVFCVVSRYHGGAFVVFSSTLNDEMEIAAVEGSHASVIGGPPAAAVVFAGEVAARTERDPRVAELHARSSQAGEAEAARLQAQLEEVRATVRAEKLGEVAAEFDAVHSVERARDVGSIDEIIPPERLRPYLIEAVERGRARRTPADGQ